MTWSPCAGVAEALGLARIGVVQTANLASISLPMRLAKRWNVCARTSWKCCRWYACAQRIAKIAPTPKCSQSAHSPTTAVSLHECRVPEATSLAVRSQLVMVGKATSAAGDNRSGCRKPMSRYNRIRLSLETANNAHRRLQAYTAHVVAWSRRTILFAGCKPRVRRLLDARLGSRAEI
jgi:hypothetical protein